MEKNYFNVIFWVLIIFQKKVLQILGFNPNRARDILGCNLLIFLLIAVKHFSIKNPFFGQKMFIAGILFGIPYSIIYIRYTFKKVKDNILYPNYQKQKYKFLLLCLLAIVLGIVLSEVFGKEGLKKVETIVIPSILFSFGLTIASLVGLFIGAIKYEEKNGILYLKDTYKK